MKTYRPILPLGIGTLLILSALEAGCATGMSAPELPQTDAAYEPISAPVQRAQSSTEGLDQLVAPITLYPDALVAQILAASTYPTEVVEAERWMQQHSQLQGTALAQAVNQQSWDASVRALTQVPAVLAMMNTNLSWTSALGEAYAEDSQSVLAAVQDMRRRAQQAGNLQSTPQESVTDEGQTITIEPASADVVYVPEYDPWIVYGAPIALYPGWIDTPGVFFEGPGVYFDAGIGIGLFGGFVWGWHHWDTDWHRRSVWYHQHPYVSHSPTFHFPDHGNAGFDHPDVGHATTFDGGHLGHPGFTNPGVRGIHTGAFGGFNHGGVVGAYSARGQASFGSGAHTGGFHAGGFAGGGFQGGGGHR